MLPEESCPDQREHLSLSSKKNLVNTTLLYHQTGVLKTFNQTAILKQVIWRKKHLWLISEIFSHAIKLTCRCSILMPEIWYNKNASNTILIEQLLVYLPVFPITLSNIRVGGHVSYSSPSST